MLLIKNNYFHIFLPSYDRKSWACFIVKRTDAPTGYVTAGTAAYQITKSIYNEWKYSGFKIRRILKNKTTEKWQYTVEECYTAFPLDMRCLTGTCWPFQAIICTVTIFGQRYRYISLVRTQTLLSFMYLVSSKEKKQRQKCIWRLYLTD
jgi:hypothetical protein